jgi:protein-tyrosine-phosphatase
MAVATAREHGLSLAHARTAHIDDVLQADDLVVAVCDNAHEELADHERLHWSVPDPARTGTDEAFERVFRELAERVDRLAPAVHPLGDNDD